MQSFTKPSRRAAVIAGAASVVVLGAVGAGAAAFADTTPSPGTSQAPAGAPTEGPGSGGPAGRQHTPHIGGTVQSVDGSTVTVKDHDGFTRTIRLASGAKVTKDGASSSVSAITKGEHIEATGTVASDGTTLDATAVSIGQPTRPAGGPDGKGGPGGRGGPGHGGEGASPAGAPTGAPSPAPSSAS